MEKPNRARRQKLETDQGEPEAANLQFSGEQGVHREVESEGPRQPSYTNGIGGYNRVYRNLPVVALDLTNFLRLWIDLTCAPRCSILLQFEQTIASSFSPVIRDCCRNDSGSI